VVCQSARRCGGVVGVGLSAASLMIINDELYLSSS